MQRDMSSASDSTRFKKFFASSLVGKIKMPSSLLPDTPIISPIDGETLVTICLPTVGSNDTTVAAAVAVSAANLSASTNCDAAATAASSAALASATEAAAVAAAAAACFALNSLSVSRIHWNIFWSATPAAAFTTLAAAVVIFSAAAAFAASAAAGCGSKRTSLNVGVIIGGFAIVSFIGLVILSLLLAIPITVLVIGLHYRDPRYCPIEPRISLFLIVHGAVGIGCLVVNIILGIIVLLFIRRDSSMAIILTSISSILSYIHGTFIWIWLIIGSVWTFSVHKQITHEYDTVNHFYTYNYCHPVLYRFAFIYLIIVYVLLGVGCCCRWLMLCCRAIE
ncbi:unnamed protein product [Rotaria sp. Silwood1]|nr:unnamed protein product [Rotaria sp. Silwood1]CAF4930532.1 unnamed protein product [Rotaria sp. Silwood1]CAF4967571.1 unnamed protein product [Rotaria sp. Silwood1]